MRFFLTIIVLVIGISAFLTTDGFGENNCLPIELEYLLKNGNVTTICKISNERTVNVELHSTDEHGGNIVLTIPKKHATSLDSLDCKTSPPFVLMDGEQISPRNTITTNSSHIFSIDFTQGEHKIEFLSSEIIPRPSPSMLCGIVLGYDSQYLPPRVQIERGVELQFIQCNADLQLVVKYDGAPACVTPENKSEFIKRGWSQPEKQTIFSKPAVKKFDQVKIDEISENAILSNGIGFDLPKDDFSQEDLKKLQQRELELRKIFENPNSSYEESESAINEFNNMQLRLQNPFQTGVPYELAKILEEKKELLGYVVDRHHYYEGEFPLASGGIDRSDRYQAIIIGIKSEHLTLENMEKFDNFVREVLGEEVNILYKR